MPLYSDPTPQWLKPENASVFDSAATKGLRKAAEWLGLTDPAQAVMGVTPTPLVSIYNNPESRMAATEAFKKTAAGISQNMGKAGEWLAAKWPRVAAHMDLQVNPIDIFEDVAAKAKLPTGKVTSQVPVEFFEKGLRDRSSEAASRELLTHEATHVAQGLGNSDAMSLYKNAKYINSADNPLETTAYRRGQAASKGLYKTEKVYRGEPISSPEKQWDVLSKPEKRLRAKQLVARGSFSGNYDSALEGLKKMIKAPGSSSTNPTIFGPSKAEANTKIKEILNRRGQM
jgi:hypothetical protein